MTAPDILSYQTIEVAIVGAGPYGLSIGCHLRHRGIPYFPN